MSLRWPIQIINPVNKTKLSCYTSHRRSTTVSLETYPSIHFNCDWVLIAVKDGISTWVLNNLPFVARRVLLVRLVTKATISEQGAAKKEIYIVYIKSLQHSLFRITTTQLLGKKQFVVLLAQGTWFFLKILHTGKRNVRFEAIILLICH